MATVDTTKSTKAPKKAPDKASSTAEQRQPPPGYARSRGKQVQDLLDDETVEVPWQLRHSEFTYLGSEPLSREHYISKEWAEREIEKLWAKVWQLACFEQDIPEVGDHIVYDIVDWSFIIVRTTPTEIKAFYNSCLHRGRQLCENQSESANSPEFRCPFHGLSWNIDGSLKQIPPSIEFDFPHVDKQKFGLPQVRCEIWDGLVFINIDDNAEPLLDFLGDVTRHFERWPFATRWKATHSAKVIDCNWKIAQEAFMEAFHVLATHPQMSIGLLGGDGSNTEYNIYDGGDANWSRMTMAPPMPNPNLPYELTERELIEEMFFRGESVSEMGVQKMSGSADDLPEGITTRKLLADAARTRGAHGYQGLPPTDMELTSAIQYHIFPNISPWPGPIFYRYRPYGHDPDKCIFEIMMMVSLPEGQPRPPAAKIKWLGPDEQFGSIFNQDVENVARVQRGMKAAKPPGHLTLTNYQDIKVRWHHRLLEKWLNA